MSLPSDTKAELDLLISRLLDAKLEPQEEQELGQILSSDPDARQLYYDRIAMHALLIWEESATPKSKLAAPIASMPTNRWRRWTALGIAALLMLTTGLIVLSFNAQQISRKAEIALTEAPTIATISRTSDCTWAGGMLPTGIGSRLSSGTLQLIQGEALIHFDSGAEIAVTGPATLELQTLMCASLRSGTLVAQIPQSASGFTIQAGPTKFVDRGTQFGVVAHESGSCELHTFAGKVEIQTEGADSHIVAAGETQSFDSAGAASPISSATAPAFDRVLNYLGGQKPERLNAKYAAQILADQPAGFWQFEEKGESTSTLATDSSTMRNPGKLHGSVKTIPGVPGAGGQALEFDGSTGFVSVAHKPHYSTPDISVELWVNSTEPWTERTWPGSAILISKDVPGDGNHDWYIIGGASVAGTNEGRVIVGVGVPPHDQQMLSPPSMNDGKWHHIVWTRDRSGANVLYIDGAVSQQMKDRGGPINNPMDIEIGGGTRSVAATPPNTKVPLGLNGKPLGDLLFLRGALDEVAVYSHVLSAEQVALHYRLGISK